MNVLIFIVGVAIALVALVLACLRFSPTNLARWHEQPDVPNDPEGDWPETGGHKAAKILEMAPDEALSRFDALARSTSRTRRVAGRVNEGLITYETRSALWGFPDYTTVAASVHDDGTRLKIHGRLRFGASDLGVNRARIEGWLSRL